MTARVRSADKSDATSTFQQQGSNADVPTYQASIWPDRRAEPPRPPELAPSSAQAEVERASYRKQRERVEYRSVLRGLALLALLALLISLWRAGLARAFYPGWWRQW